MPTGSSEKPLPPPPPENGPLAALLSFVVPGLGQIVQGRVGKGVLFFACIHLLFFTGLALGSGKNVYLPDTPPDPAPRAANAWKLPPLVIDLINRPHFGAQFWVGAAAWPAIYQYVKYDDRVDEKAAPLNGFMRQPTEETLQELQRDGDKTWDLAWVYTVIAGVLNLMVIYDAFAGPAFARRPAEARREGATADGTAAVTAAR